MPTNYTQRLTLICPAARQAALTTWWAANIDQGGAGALTFTVGLSSDGTPPAVAYWASVALTAADLRAIVLRLCTLAGIAAPTGWNTWTRQQQLDWLQTNLPIILANTGIRVVRSDNDGETWADPDDALAAHGLQRMAAGD